MQLRYSKKKVVCRIGEVIWCWRFYTQWTIEYSIATGNAFIGLKVLYPMPCTKPLSSKYVHAKISSPNNVASANNSDILDFAT